MCFRINSIYRLTKFLWIYFVVATFNATLVNAEDDKIDFRAPGKMYDIGTHKMHMNCTGESQPTVVIDSGVGGFSLEWADLQEQLAKFNRVCTYDRSGYGWSEESPYPRTTQVIADELYLLLKSAEINGPYILVGHSFGGYNIRYFASEHPELVRGLVFIDSSHPEQYDRMPKYQPEIKSEHRDNSWTVRISMPKLNDHFPERFKRLAYVLMSTYKAQKTQIAELENFNISAKQVIDNDHLGNIPVTVVTRARRVWPDNAFGDESEKVWQVLQNELAELGSTSSHLLAYQSGHLVHLDQPKLVYGAIHKMAELGRYSDNPDEYIVKK